MTPTARSDEIRVAAERLARVHVRQVHFDERDRDRRQRVAQRDAGMRERARVDQDEGGPFRLARWMRSISAPSAFDWKLSSSCPAVLALGAEIGVDLGQCRHGHRSPARAGRAGSGSGRAGRAGRHPTMFRAAGPIQGIDKGAESAPRRTICPVSSATSSAKIADVCHSGAGFPIATSRARFGEVAGPPREKLAVAADQHGVRQHAAAVAER